MKNSQLYKGSLSTIIMKLLEENGRMYGYEITQKVAILTQGQITLTYGALYPVLHKLEKEGALLTESEIINNRNRIYYKLTKKGNDTAREKIKELEDFINTIGILLKPEMGK